MIPADHIITEHGLFDVPLAATPEQLAAWEQYQQARHAAGLLTEAEHAQIFGGRTAADSTDFDARR